MWQILIQTKRDYLEALGSILEETCATVSFNEIDDPNAKWHSDDWSIEGHSFSKPNTFEIQLEFALVATSLGIKKPKVVIQPLEETNWLETMWEKFPPQTVSRFFIHGSAYTDAIPEDKIPIKLDAATAFGSGEHGTTAGCLTALCDIFEKGAWKSPLDLGCGSGILAIAACKLNPVATLAIDNDHEAVRVTQNNAILNQVEHVTTQQGDGLQGIDQTFDLIMANILAAPLIEFSQPIAQCLQPSGYVILSGFLDWQEEDVRHAYEAQGLKPVKMYNLNRWITLVFQK